MATATTIGSRDLRPAITKLSSEKIVTKFGEIDTALTESAVGVREEANDAAIEIVKSDGYIEIADSTTGDKAITTNTTTNAVLAGQVVRIKLLAATGNSYTLAVQGGTLTFNAAGEAATVRRNAANTAWLVSDLEGATVV